MPGARLQKQKFSAKTCNRGLAALNVKDFVSHPKGVSLIVIFRRDRQCPMLPPSQAANKVSPADPKADRSYESAEKKQSKDKDQPDEEPKEQDRRVEDVAFILGVPAADITPEIQKGLGNVMSEFDRQRRELDSLRKRVAFLERKSDTHPFLQVMSRHALERTMMKVVNRADQADTENCFVCFQLEGLEAIRRLEGLPVADLIVTNTANMIKTALRASDIIGSMGGYGMGVIFAVTSFEGAEEKARLLVPAIENRLQATYPALRLVYGIYLIKPQDTIAHIFAAADADLRQRSDDDQAMMSGNN